MLLIVGGILAGLVILGSLLPDTTTTQGGSQESGAPAQPEPDSHAGGLNTSVRDGKFEFTVTEVRCGVPQVGSPYLNKKAQGEFCLVSVHVENIGDEGQTLHQGNQYLFDSAGRRYETSDANLYVEDNKTFLEEINPGNAVDGTLVFDVPKGFAPSKIELHDSPFSGGVTIKL